VFKIQDFSDYLKERSLPRYRLAVPEGGSKCARHGLIETMRLGGCTSCVILSEGSNRIGATTHYRPIHVEDHLAELRRLTGQYTELADAQNIALLWDGENRKSRYSEGGNVYMLYSGLQEIFKGRIIEEISYPGMLDWVGLDVDMKLLLIKHM